MVTQQAAIVAVIDQFKILMFAMQTGRSGCCFFCAGRGRLINASKPPHQGVSSWRPGYCGAGKVKQRRYEHDDIRVDTLRDTRIHLAHGTGELPAAGFGTLIPDPLATRQATQTALEVGFRHLDCAERYRNEEAVGDAIQSAFKAETLRREDLFVTTKLWNSNHRPERVKPAFDASRRRLQLDYIDCYLIHTPFAFQPGDEQDPRDEQGRGDAD